MQTPCRDITKLLEPSTCFTFHSDSSGRVYQVHRTQSVYWSTVHRRGALTLACWDRKPPAVHSPCFPITMAPAVTETCVDMDLQGRVGLFREMCSRIPVLPCVHVPQSGSAELVTRLTTFCSEAGGEPMGYLSSYGLGTYCLFSSKHLWISCQVPRTHTKPCL